MIAVVPFQLETGVLGTPCSLVTGSWETRIRIVSDPTPHPPGKSEAAARTLLTAAAVRFSAGRCRPDAAGACLAAFSVRCPCAPTPHHPPNYRCRSPFRTVSSSTPIHIPPHTLPQRTFLRIWVTRRSAGCLPQWHAESAWTSRACQWKRTSFKSKPGTAVVPP